MPRSTRGHRVWDSSAAFQRDFAHDRAFGISWAANIAQHLVLTSCLTLYSQTYIKHRRFERLESPVSARPSRFTQLALISNSKFVRFPLRFCLFIASSDAAACFTDLTPCPSLVMLSTAASCHAALSPLAQCCWACGGATNPCLRRRRA